MASFAEFVPGYEGVLLPITLERPVNGGFGSVWTSQLALYNAGSTRIAMRDVYAECSALCPDTVRLEPGEVEIARPSPRSDRSAGHIVYFRTQDIPYVRFNLRIQDISRQALTWGTELPVVRERQFTSEPIHLINIPTDSRFRQTLRVYSFDGFQDFTVRAIFIDMSSGATLKELTLELHRDEYNVTPYSYFPGYAQIDALADTLPELRSATRFRVELHLIEPAARIWAFVTVTNNETQHVTTVTPQ